MTQDEAIALLNEQYETCKRIYDCSADQRKSYPNVPQFMEALGMSLAALRSVSREQVEKGWRGEWKIVEYEFFTCTRCGDSYYNGAESTEQAESYLNSGHVYDFCPHCGSANTEKAVQMVMERLEALHSETKTD